MTSQTDNEAVELSGKPGGECFSCRRMVRPVPAGSDPAGDPCIRTMPSAVAGTGSFAMKKAKHCWRGTNGKFITALAVVDELEFARQSALADALTAG